MNPTLRTDSRPEAMADVQGGCTLSLTRGIIVYREQNELEAAGGRIEDIGIGLVVEGRFAAEATVVDLGSGRAKCLDLSGELVVLDWAYDPTVEHVRRLIHARSTGPAGDGPPIAGAAGDEPSISAGAAPDGGLEAYCFDLALRVLKRAGYGPLTRPAFLRIGFRDICRDLDFHEGAAIRLAAGDASLCRIHLDCDSAALVVHTSTSSPHLGLEGALGEFLPSSTLRKVERAPSGTARYALRFPLPVDLAEARTVLAEIRGGLDRLIERFEPRRHRTVTTMLKTFGVRDTLARVQPVERNRAVTSSAPTPAGVHRVH